MRTKIYQINTDRDHDRVKFEDFDRLQRLQNSEKIDPSIYDEVFNAEIDETGLEDIYRRFNTVGYPLYRGHSLSVSDVVVTDQGAFYCDTVGFRKVDFDESLAHKPDDLMRVVYVEPNRPAYEAEIADDWKAGQKAVGGLIEMVVNGDGTCIVCNDEGKLIGMEGNRRLDNGFSIIAGPFFICGMTEEDFRSLTDDETAKYLNRFAEPEQISQEEVEADTGFTIISM